MDDETMNMTTMCDVLFLARYVFLLGQLGCILPLRARCPLNLTLTV